MPTVFAILIQILSFEIDCTRYAPKISACVIQKMQHKSFNTAIEACSKIACRPSTIPVTGSQCIQGVGNNVCFSPYQHMMGSPTMVEAMKKTIQTNSEYQKLNETVEGRLYYALGSAGVADNSGLTCATKQNSSDPIPTSCAMKVGYQNINLGRCFQIQYNTGTQIDSEKRDINETSVVILQSVNIGLNNAFDLYMANGGAGAWASNEANGRSGACAWLYGSTGGFDANECAERCSENATKTKESVELCQNFCWANKCPQYDFKTCAEKCNKEDMSCHRCRVYCQTSPRAGHEANQWRIPLQDLPLCQRNIQDAHLYGEIQNYYNDSWFRPIFDFPNGIDRASWDATVSFWNSAYHVIKSGIGCQNGRGTWQQIKCPSEIEDISGMQLTSAADVTMCSDSLQFPDCNPNLNNLKTDIDGLPHDTAHFGGTKALWQHDEYMNHILRTDAQITQMMDCRSPTASQCFQISSYKRFAENRTSAWNVGADGQLITNPGVRGCANVPGVFPKGFDEKNLNVNRRWNNHMGGPLPYVQGDCPIAFPPNATDCVRYQNTAVCPGMIARNKTLPTCWPEPDLYRQELDTTTASNQSCWQTSGDDICDADRVECTTNGDVTCDSIPQCSKCFAQDQYYAACFANLEDAKKHLKSNSTAGYPKYAPNGTSGGGGNVCDISRVECTTNGDVTCDSIPQCSKCFAQHQYYAACFANLEDAKKYLKSNSTAGYPKNAPHGISRTVRFQYDLRWLGASDQPVICVRESGSCKNVTTVCNPSLFCDTQDGSYTVRKKQITCGKQTVTARSDYMDDQGFTSEIDSCDISNDDTAFDYHCNDKNGWLPADTQPGGSDVCNKTLDTITYCVNTRDKTDVSPSNSSSCPKGFKTVKQLECR